MLKKFKYSFILFLSIIFIKCANISAPNGGPKDNTAPILKKNYPLNKTTNFKDKIIIIEFNEAIKINNPAQEIQIIPSVGNGYKVSSKKKSITLEFTKSLKENTTYRVNFNKSIVDITESNIAKDISLIFSTGNQLDSLYIKGKVIAIEKNKNSEAIVGIYKCSDTLNIFKQQPYIYTKCINGTYSLENIKEGIYDIIAFDDVNNNLQLDENETFGFNDKLTELRNSINSLNINIFNRKKIDSLKIINTYTIGNKIDIDFNNEIKEASIKGKNIAYTINNKHLYIYNLGNYKDSLEIQLAITDSNDFKINKTLKFKTETKKNKKELPSIQPLPNSKINIDKAPIEISFSKPIKGLGKNSLIKMKIDSNGYKYLKNNENYTINEYNDKILLYNNIIAKDSIKIEMETESLLTINDDSVYSLAAKYLINDITETGSIQGKIITHKSYFIIQLLDDQYIVKEAIRNNTNYQFNKLKPGKYNIRVIEDENNNGKWDLGNYHKRQQPERVSYYPDQITLKENWEVLDININID